MQMVDDCLVHLGAGVDRHIPPALSTGDVDRKLLPGFVPTDPLPGLERIFFVLNAGEHVLVFIALSSQFLDRRFQVGLLGFQLFNRGRELVDPNERLGVVLDTVR